MKSLLISSLVFFCCFSWAKVDVLFHPSESSLNEIARHLGKATRTIDIAMYNMDASIENPVIAMLASSTMQTKIKSGQLQIRILFEGYENPSKLSAKKTKFEKLGVDVRHIAFNKKMHHKFAVIDGFTNSPVLITGSANWSLFSQNNYNENILIFTEMPGASYTFQNQFQFLWDHSQDFGKDFGFAKSSLIKAPLENGLSIVFNSENFIISGIKNIERSKKTGFVITKEIVKLIDKAQDKIEIATTRIKLRPIYDALVRAAQRGVKTEIIVTMEQYEFQGERIRKTVPQCKLEFSKRCSTGKNFSVFLSRNDFDGSQNISLRAKYFNIKKTAHLSKQMHSKYIIVDDQIITGSFNWSYSSEYNHLENIIKVDGRRYPEVLSAFRGDFAQLWHLNREKYQALTQFFEDAVVNNYKVRCDFDPLSLNFREIDYLLNSGQRYKKSLSAVCL